MKRIVALDFGTKRCGLAVTDPLGMFAQGLTTIPPNEVVPFLTTYHNENPVGQLVVGMPTRMDGTASDVESEIQKFITSFEKAFPDIVIERFDERFTSKMALDTMLQSGVSKKKRRKKETLDKISATIILQEFLETQTR